MMSRRLSRQESHSTDEDEDANVLYDILVFHEWPVDLSSVQRDERTDEEPGESPGSFQQLARGLGHLIRPLIGSSGLPHGTLAKFQSVMAAKMNWKFAVSQDCSKVIEVFQRYFKIKGLFLHY